MSQKTMPRCLPLVCLLIASLACSRLPGGGATESQATANAAYTQDAVRAATARAPALVFTPDQLSPATAGQSYTATITITQNATPVGEMTVSLADLPPGLNFAFIKGQDAAAIGGTPLTTGTYTFTVSAWCLGTNTAGQTGRHTYTVVVK